ncbi:MAG: phosphomannomutase [Telluria sp.]
MTQIFTLEQVAARSGVRFGTSGARGLVTDLTAPVCQAYVDAFLVACAANAPAVVLGWDLRPSSAGIARLCAATVRASGRAVVYAGVLPTPALAHYALLEGLPALMVTGSHIPFDRNGLKFYTRCGEISKADEQAMLAAELTPRPLPEMAEAACDPAVLRAYRARYERFFNPGFLAGRRIGVYEHSSVARDILGQLLEHFGATVIALGRTDHFVPVDTEAVAEADRIQARAWTRKHQLDALISTDGDADRPLLADETGEWFRGDLVGLLCARFLGIQAVALPVSCNSAVEHSGAFERVVRTRIGSPYVIAAMHTLQETGGLSVAGFEANGGFLLGSDIVRDDIVLARLPTRDAVLPTLAVLAAAAQRGTSLSALKATLPQRFTASDRIQEFPPARSAALLERLAAEPAEISRLFADTCGTPAGTDLTDGVRIRFSNGEIVHLRASGNAPELRCYAEAATEARAEELVRRALARVTTA